MKLYDSRRAPNPRRVRWFMAEKGMIVNTPPDMAPFRAKLKDVGFYKEWKEKMGAEAWNQLEEISGPMT